MYQFFVQFTNQIKQVLSKVDINNIEMAYDLKYYSSAGISIIVLNSISFLSLALIIIIYIILWKKIASFPMRLSFYLCISCIVQSLYVLTYNPILVNQQTINPNDSSPAAQGYCVFESLIKTAFDLSAIIWTSLIIYSSYASVCLKSNLESKQFIYLIIGFVFPVIVSLMYMFYSFRPIFLGYYGPDTYFCWFDAPNASIQLGLKMGYFFGPLWLLFILNVFWSIKTYRTLKHMGLEQRQLNIFKKLLLFPLILLVTGFFSTIDIIYIYVTSDFIPWLDIISMILLSCYGLFTSIAYGFNPLLRDQILILIGVRKVQIVELSDRSSTSRQTEKIENLAEYLTVNQ